MMRLPWQSPPKPGNAPSDDLGNACGVNENCASSGPATEPAGLAPTARYAMQMPSKIPTEKQCAVLIETLEKARLERVSL